MDREINESQKHAIDELFLNGFNRKKAYAVAYPNCKEVNLTVGMFQIMKKQAVKDYYQQKHKEWREALGMDKYQIIDGLRKQIELFDDMQALSLKDELTDKEIAKLKRISELVKGSDIMKAKDMICRIIGAYEPEKVIVENTTYTVGFDMSSDEAEIIP
tara:strand:+ start:1167 stop:1643 length:477 start_codon:yes stop_codon:yes gene_type:complete